MMVRPESLNTPLTPARKVLFGVYFADSAQPTDMLEAGSFLTSDDFGQAGIDAGKSFNYGRGLLRDVAHSMIQFEAENLYEVNGRGGYVMRGTPEYDLYYEIWSQHHSNGIMVATQLVHDIWALQEGSQLVEDADLLPSFGKVGHHILSQLFISTPAVIQR